LMEERHLFRTLMDNLPDAIYFKDRESRFTRNNRANARKFGLSDPAQAIGKTDFDFFTEAHAQPAFADEQEIIRTGQPMLGKEEKETWPDGHVTWASTTEMPLRDTNGDIIGTFGVSRDITERRRVEEALQSSERHMKVIMDGSPLPQFDIDKNHRVTHWNRALEEYSGIKSEDVIGTNQHWRAFYPGERPCMADLLVEGAIDTIRQLYASKYSPSRLIEGAFEATDFFPAMRGGTWLHFIAAPFRDPD